MRLTFLLTSLHLPKVKTSEEFKDKAKTIFEAAVVSRLNEELDRMHEEYAKVLEEEIDSVKKDLAEKVDEYLTYSVSQWME